MTEPPSDDLLALAAPVGDAFRAAGYRVYLVGGAVRDQLLGRAAGAASDLDLTTDARPDVIKEVVDPLSDAVWTQGERFGTIGCRIDGRIYEITTHRAERYDTSSRKPDVDFSSSIEDDLSRRDFTINAMARELPEGTLIDPFGGRADLEQRRLMTPIDPHLSFTDDPLRMLRAARFVATYGVELDAAAERALDELSDRLSIVSAERVRDEIVRLLEADDPTAGLELLVRTGLADRFLPELAEADLEALRTAPPDAVVRLGVVLVDDGVDRATARLRELRFANSDMASVGRMMRSLQGLAAAADSETDEARRRFVVASRPDTERALALARARGADAALADAVHDLIRREGSDGFAPPVTGGDLIAELDLEPGPLVGQAMTWLADERLRRGPMRRADALEAARAWLADR